VSVVIFSEGNVVFQDSRQEMQKHRELLVFQDPLLRVFASDRHMDIHESQEGLALRYELLVPGASDIVAESLDSVLALLPRHVQDFTPDRELKISALDFPPANLMWIAEFNK
jgi:hypothetical protein